MHDNVDQQRSLKRPQEAAAGSKPRASKKEKKENSSLFSDIFGKRFIKHGVSFILSCLGFHGYKSYQLGSEAMQKVEVYRKAVAELQMSLLDLAWMKRHDTPDNPYYVKNIEENIAQMRRALGMIYEQRYVARVFSKEVVVPFHELILFCAEVYGFCRSYRKVPPFMVGDEEIMTKINKAFEKMPLSNTGVMYYWFLAMIGMLKPPPHTAT